MLQLRLAFRHRLYVMHGRLARSRWWPPSRGPRLHGRMAAAAIATMVALAALDLWLFTCGFDRCPSGEEIRAYAPPEGGRVVDRNGKTMGRLNLVRRVNVRLSDVPEHVQRAFIATEDRRFYSHGGLDWRAVGRAVARNVASFGVREGFSTITMQVARNTFLAHRTTAKRSLPRKLLELRLAALLERHLSKDEILELYLNAIYLGNGVYGVEAASRDLFGKRVRDVNVAEGAMLAALPKGPSYYTPRRDHARALARRNLVLTLMEREGDLSAPRAAAARARPLVVSRNGWRPPAVVESYAVDLVRTLVDSVLRAQRRTGTEVTVYTTLDPAAQQAAERAVRRTASEVQRQATGWWEGEAASRRETGAVEGAMVALDPRTGDIRALVGGRAHRRGAFNRAVAARRQPGSAFKPFVYAAALEAGFTPATLVDDEPVAVDQGNGDLWRPANYDGDYAGRVTVHRALSRSANAATVRLSRAVGERNVILTASRNGIESPMRAVPSLALGALEVTPLELVAAYAPFANGGLRVRPRIVRRIEAADGTVLWSAEPQPSPAMDARDAFQMNAMLRGVIDGGTGHVLRDWGVDGPIGGKTGTTNDGTDVWFVGFTPTVVAGFWFGYDSPRSLGEGASGARLAAPAWARFYLEGWRERGEDWEAPAGLVERDIDPETGALANEWCPLRTAEWFRPGTEPLAPCQEHEEPIFTDWVGDLDRDIASRIARALRRIFRP